MLNFHFFSLNFKEIENIKNIIKLYFIIEKVYQAIISLWKAYFHLIKTQREIERYLYYKILKKLCCFWKKFQNFTRQTYFQQSLKLQMSSGYYAKNYQKFRENLYQFKNKIIIISFTTLRTNLLQLNI